MCYYVIIISEGTQNKYLFNTRMLVHDAALAKQFSSIMLAKRYLRKSLFISYQHQVIPYTPAASDSLPGQNLG